MHGWLHRLAKWSAVPLTGFGPALGAALLRISSLHERQTARSARCASSPRWAPDACSTSATDGCGESSRRSGASAARSSSRSLPARDSETAPCADLSFLPGSAAAAVELLTGLGTVLGHEIRAAWNAGEDGLGETLELLLVAVIDTAEVITDTEGLQS
jgi:hypothetical protein